MPTRVRLSCPSCGIVETYNYDWPDDQSKVQTCPICSSKSDFISAVLVPVEGNVTIVEPKEKYYGEEREDREERDDIPDPSPRRRKSKKG